MRHFFIVTAVFETATGVLLLLQPSVVFAFLFGWREVGPETALIARVGGGAVLGLGAASWLVRGDGGARAQSGLLTGLLIYNVVAVMLLAFAGAVLKMVGLLLWPAVIYHVVLGAWCVNCLRRKPERKRR